MIDQQLPTIEDLLTWAGEKPPQHPIGKVGSIVGCPIACYLNEQEEDKARSWQIGLDRIETPDDGRFMTPPHLRSVINHVDGCPGCEDGDYIYPPQFIHILQTIQQRMKKGV